MSELDSKALEAATLALLKAEGWTFSVADAVDGSHHRRLMEIAITAYLAALPTPAISGFDETDLDMIRRGDMLGHRLGERVFAALTALPAPATQEVSKKAITINLSDKEIEVLEALAEKQDLSPVAVIRQGLRHYQLLVEGAPDLGSMMPPEAATQEVDELREKLASFSKYLKRCAEENGSQLSYDRCLIRAKEIDAAIEALAPELREDTARLDWLEMQSKNGPTTCAFQPSNIRAQIDRARAAEKDG